MNRALNLNLPFPVRFQLSFSFKTLKLLFVFLLLFLLAVCIYQLNLYVKQVYQIQNYKNKLNQLSQENKILEINFSNANSLKNIGNYLQNQSFEKVTKVEYIQLLENTVLAK